MSNFVHPLGHYKFLKKFQAIMVPKFLYFVKKRWPFDTGFTAGGEVCRNHQQLSLPLNTLDSRSARFAIMQKLKSQLLLFLSA